MSAVPAEIMVALEKMLDKMTKGSPALPPGTYIVKDQLVIELDCVINKDNDEKYIPTISIPLKTVLALMLQKAGAIRDHIANLMKECMVQAVTGGASLKELLQSETEEVEKYMDEVNTICASGGTSTRTGKTFVKGSISVNTSSSSARKVV